MRRPPRDPGEPLFSGQVLWLSVAQGSAALAITAASYGWGLGRVMTTEAVRSLVFLTMVGGNLALLLANRSRSGRSLALVGNRAVGWVLALAVSGLVLVFGWPSLRALFRFAPPDLGMTITGLVATAASLVAFELLKRLWRVRPRTTQR